MYSHAAPLCLKVSVFLCYINMLGTMIMLVIFMIQIIAGIIIRVIRRIDKHLPNAEKCELH